MGLGPELTEEEATCVARSKYNYIISAQQYGKQRAKNDPKADDIDFLLKTFPSLRVAYIAEDAAVPDLESGGGNASSGGTVYSSVLCALSPTRSAC